jgi:hypothetical protein
VALLLRAVGRTEMRSNFSARLIPRGACEGCFYFVIFGHDVSSCFQIGLLLTLQERF